MLKSTFSIDELSESILNDILSNKQKKAGGKALGRKADQRSQPRLLPSIDSNSKQDINFRIGGAQRVSHLIHRAVALSGFVPGEFRHQAHSGHDANLIQWECVEDSAALREGVADVFSLFDEVNAISEELYHRKDLSARLVAVNERYVHLVQTILSGVLFLQRDIFRAQSAAIESLQKENVRISALLAAERSVAKEATERMKLFSDRCSHFENVNQDLTSRLKLLQDKIDDEEDQQRDGLRYVQTRFPDVLEHLRESYRQQQERIFDEKFKKLKRDFEAQQAQADLKRAKFHRAELEKLRKSLSEDMKSSQAVDEPAGLVVDPDSFKRPSRDNETQTQVDEQGLWDVSDGWTLPVTKTALVRQKWRQAMKFASCPSCKGMGSFVLNCFSLLKKSQRNQSLFTHQHRKNKWQYPDEIVTFLSHLPRSIQAENPQSLAWVMRKVLFILEARHQVMIYDESHDHAQRKANQQHQHQQQPLFEFILEMFLVREARRSNVEVALHRFVYSLGEHFSRHPLLQVFSRFLGLLENNATPVVENSPQRPPRSYYLRGEKATEVLNQRERAKGIRWPQQKPPDYIPVSEYYLPAILLSPFLCLRSMLLAAYTGIYASRMKEVEDRTKCFSLSAQRLGREVGWGTEVPSHVYVSDDHRWWIPMDRVIRVMHGSVGLFMDQTHQAAIIRTLEHDSRFLLPTGDLIEPEVMHMVVRTQVRRIQLALTDDGRDVSWEEIEAMIADAARPVGEDGKHEPSQVEPKVPLPGDPPELPVQQTNKDYDHTIFFDLDHFLQLLLDVLLNRLHEEELKIQTAFMEHVSEDGFISLHDFGAAVRKIEPKCGERVVLSMFREFQQVYEGNAVSIQSADSESFLSICNSHGMLKIETDVWRHKSLSALYSVSHDLHSEADVIPELKGLRMNESHQAFTRRKSIRRMGSGGGEDAKGKLRDAAAAAAALSMSPTKFARNNSGSGANANQHSPKVDKITPKRLSKVSGLSSVGAVGATIQRMLSNSKEAAVASPLATENNAQVVEALTKPGSAKDVAIQRLSSKFKEAVSGAAGGGGGSSTLLPRTPQSSIIPAGAGAGAGSAVGSDLSPQFNPEPLSDDLVEDAKSADRSTATAHEPPPLINPFSANRIVLMPKKAKLNVELSAEVSNRVASQLKLRQLNRNKSTES